MGKTIVQKNLPNGKMVVLDILTYFTLVGGVSSDVCRSSCTTSTYYLGNKQYTRTSIEQHGETWPYVVDDPC